VKETVIFEVKATQVTNGTKKAGRDFKKAVKTALKAVTVDGAKIVVKG
jgi:hypothetical protein